MQFSERPSIKDLFGPATLKAQRDWESREFESEVVQVLCARYRLGRRTRLKLLGESQSEGFEERYCLAAFNKIFPQFPLTLFAQNFPKVEQENPVHKIFMDFPSRPFVKKFLKLRAAVKSDDRPRGLVFHWPHIDGSRYGMSAMVVHDWDGPSRLFTTECVLELDDKQIFRIYLDSLPHLLDAIDDSCPMYRPRLWMD